MPRPAIPEDKVNLRLILVSGKTKDYLFKPTDSAGEIAQYVFDNWPIDWSEEAVSSAEILRMIYQGRFLHGNVTLAALGLPTGKTTVMHLVPRESLPEPNSQDDENKKKGRSRGCCSCSLLWTLILVRKTHHHYINRIKQYQLIDIRIHPLQ